MSIKELQQQTTVNVQEKANLIWAIADKLVGEGIRGRFSDPFNPFNPQSDPQ